MSSIKFNVTKADDKQMLWGWASMVSKDGEPVVDLHGDVITEDTLEKAAYEFVLNYRVAGNMHRQLAGRLIESMVFTKEKQELLGIDLGKVAWWVGIKIDDPAVWEMVKNGDRPMLSIAGRAKRVPYGA